MLKLLHCCYSCRKKYTMSYAMQLKVWQNITLVMTMGCQHQEFNMKSKEQSLCFKTNLKSFNDLLNKKGEIILILYFFIC